MRQEGYGARSILQNEHVFACNLILAAVKVEKFHNVRPVSTSGINDFSLILLVLLLIKYGAYWYITLQLCIYLHIATLQIFFNVKLI